MEKGLSSSLIVMAQNQASCCVLAGKRPVGCSLWTELQSFYFILCLSVVEITVVIKTQTGLSLNNVHHEGFTDTCPA